MNILVVIDMQNDFIDGAWRYGDGKYNYGCGVVAKHYHHPQC